MLLEYKVIDNKFYNVKDVLKGHFQISDRLLTKLKKSDHIKLNNSNCYLDKTLSLNDIITCDLDFEEESLNIVPTKMNLEIIYEDDAIIIVNKPANLAIHPSMSHYENTLSNGVKFYFDSINLKRKIRPVNRLDKDTSGLVIFAKNEYIQECLIKQMKQNEFKKEYFAILDNHLENTSGTINKPIDRKPDSIIEREINPNGENAITHYELIENFIINDMKLSLVKFILETGRTHQIRVHSKSINHPIIGDTLYNKESELIARQALHAYKITFIHPVLNEKLTFEIELPEDMKNILNKKETAI